MWNLHEEDEAGSSPTPTPRFGGWREEYLGIEDMRMRLDTGISVMILRRPIMEPATKTHRLN